jgi:hypothetical protein
LSGTGWEACDIGNMIAAQQSYQLCVAIHCRLQDIDLLMRGKKADTFSDIA